MPERRERTRRETGKELQEDRIRRHTQAISKLIEKGKEVEHDEDFKKVFETDSEDEESTPAGMPCNWSGKALQEAAFAQREEDERKRKQKSGRIRGRPSKDPRRRRGITL